MADLTTTTTRRTYSRTPVVLAYGGGLDSFTLLTIAIEAGITIDEVVFVDVGNVNDRSIPGEWPGTLRHIDEVARPMAEAAGIKFTVIDGDTYPIRRNGTTYHSMHEWMLEAGIIPTSSGHSCTLAAKVERFEAYLADTYGADEVEVWIGFDAAEGKRVAKGEAHTGARKDITRRNRFPLVEWNLCRCKMEAMLAELGLPIPHKSACMGCPQAKAADFRKLRDELPAQWAQVLELEAAKAPTRSGFKLSLKAFAKHTLSVAQLAALQGLRLDADAKVNKRTLAGLVARSWVEGRKLTAHGRKILDLVHGGDLEAGANVADTFAELGLEVLEGVHYSAPTLDAWAAKAGAAKVPPCSVCGSSSPAVKDVGCGYKAEGSLVGIRLAA